MKSCLIVDANRSIDIIIHIEELMGNNTLSKLDDHNKVIIIKYPASLPNWLIFSSKDIV